MFSSYGGRTSYSYPNGKSLVPPLNHMRFSLKGALMGFDVPNHLNPRWWARSERWITFMLHHADRSSPPVDPWLQIPWYPRRLPDSAEYTMSIKLAHSWSQRSHQCMIPTTHTVHRVSAYCVALGCIPHDDVRMSHVRFDE